MSQSTTEINMTFRDWLDNFAPKWMIQSERNFGLLADYIRDHRQGIVTTTVLNQTAETLRSQLDVVKEPTQQEISDILSAKMRRDYLNSIKPQPKVDWVEKVNAKKAADDTAKEIKRIESLITSEIDGYGDVSSGKYNYSSTDSKRDSLRSVRDKYHRKTVDNVSQALMAVRAAKMKL
jgi:hypothetical protein